MKKDKTENCLNCIFLDKVNRCCSIEEDKEFCGTIFKVTDIVSKPFRWKGLSFTDQVDHYVGHEAEHIMISADMLEIVN